MRLAAVTVACVAGLAACSPVEDWRDVRPPGSGAVLLFPCKPSALTRTLTLAGHPVALTLLACSTGGNTYALAHGDVEAPARVEPALQALAAAAAANIGTAPVAGEAASVAGMTPNPQARRLELNGTRPDGTAVRGHVMTFAHGTRVFQATVLGASPSADTVATFFDSVRLAA